jgi:hypothetical protein
MVLGPALFAWATSLAQKLAADLTALAWFRNGISVPGEVSREQVEFQLQFMNPARFSRLEEHHLCDEFQRRGVGMEVEGRKGKEDAEPSNPVAPALGMRNSLVVGLGLAVFPSVCVHASVDRFPAWGSEADADLHRFPLMLPLGTDADQEYQAALAADTDDLPPYM